MSFSIYAVGTLILIAGVIYVAHLVHMPSKWIVACVLIAAGRGDHGWRFVDAAEGPS